jgi:peptide/nickel transport system permease protein
LRMLAYPGLVLILILVLYLLRQIYNSRRLAHYYWDRIRRHRQAVGGLVFIGLLMLLAVFGPFFTPDPAAVNFAEQSIPPCGFTRSQAVYDITTDKFTVKDITGSWQHPLGTDDKGRDMLAMLISGTRVSLAVGLLSTLIAIFIGTVMGVVSGYLGGWPDNILMRFTDIMMTFPFFLLLVFIVFLYGPSLTFIIMAIGLTGWTGTARMIRSEALSLRTREYVLAAKALGVSNARIIFRHLVPNVMSTVVVIATLSIPGVILAEAGLSFIGLGDPSVISWGTVLYAGEQAMTTSWWIAVEPGIVLLLTVLAFNFLGEGIREAFDPRSVAFRR